MTQPVLCAATHRITAGVNAFYRLTVSSSAPLRAQQRYLDVVQAWLCNDITDWVDDETVCQALSNLLGLDVHQTCEHLGAFVGREAFVAALAAAPPAHDVAFVGVAGLDDLGVLIAAERALHRNAADQR